MIWSGIDMPEKTPAEKKAKDAAWAEYVAAENARVRKQRRWLTLRRRPGLVLAMLDRAWALLDCGETEAADALLEFVPEAQAEALLREFFGEDE